jgi:putative two-component system response regulator
MVDDEPDFQILLLSWLAPRYDCCPLKSGDELTGALRGGAPDLVILDVVMPETDGFEVCRRLRATPGLEAVPVLFLTGSLKTQDYLRSLRVGGTSYLTKPVAQARLLAAVDELVGAKAGPAQDEGGGD